MHPCNKKGWHSNRRLQFWLPGYVGLFSCTRMELMTVLSNVIRWLPGYVGLFSCTWRRNKGMKNNTLATLVIARLCRAFFMHYKKGWHSNRRLQFCSPLWLPGYVGLFSYTFIKDETTYVAPTGDCPVMSGFFHAHKVCDRCGDRIEGVRDCPVMSGFFHAQLY